MIEETYFLNGMITQYDLEISSNKTERRVIIETEKTLPSHGISRIRRWAYYTNSLPTMRRLKKAYEQGIKVHLVVEVADMYSKILSSRYFRHDKASKVTPASFEAMFQALMTR